MTTQTKVRSTDEALKLIADIASGSTTANSLQHIAKIAQEALSSEAMKAQSEQEQCYGHKGKCDRIMPDGKLCQLNAPCPDCGMSLIDYPKPEQEPVAWIRRHPNGALSNEVLIHVQVEPVRRESGAWVPLYTTPPQRKPLTITEESAWDLARYVYARSNPHESPQILLTAMEIKQIIEAAHGIKEKNT